MNEYERRRRAVQMVQAEVSPNEIATKLGRSRAWVYKSAARFEEGGLKALHDRSRAPHRQPRSISDSMVKRILSIRHTLQRKTGRRRFAGVGADAIAWELHLRGCKDIPALRTIERVVARAGLTRGKQGRARRADPRPYPAPVARQPGDVHQCDMVGPRHIATARGPLRFFIYNTVDVAGGGVSSFQDEQRTSDTYCFYLVKWVWPRLGIPRVLQVDNEMVLAGFPGRPQGFTAPVRLALLFGVKVLFIPEGEPGRQANVESFNALWQERVLRRFRFKTLAALRRTSERFEKWFMAERPHPQLRGKTHGTVFPSELLQSLDGQIRRLPKGFFLEKYIGDSGRLELPLARGRIAWIRLVGDDGMINISGKPFRAGRRFANQYVTATLSTSRRMLTIKIDRTVVARHPFPIEETVVKPLLQVPNGG